MKELDVKLKIIGDGPNYKKLNEYIQNEGLVEKVEIIKKVKNSDLNEYYNESNIYAQPLENLDGIPIPVLEAMACGLPIVMSKHSDKYSEIIDNAVVFVKNDVQSFQDAFIKILSDENLQSDLATKSLDIIKRISGEKMEEEEIGIYKKFF